MRVGLLVLEVYLHGCASLKEKRRVIRSLTERARSRHNVATAEVDFQDLHQRSQLAFVSVASHEQPLQALFDRILAEAEEIVPGGVSEIARDVLG
ncbi:MAG: DUF503 domain-containing protein [Acidobacteria bacterium]|nr:DUF503 domain-containing protein [Acidobacteriota bacterium]